MKLIKLALASASLLALCALLACGDDDGNSSVGPGQGGEGNLLSSEEPSSADGASEAGESSETVSSEVFSSEELSSAEASSETATSSASAGRCDDASAWSRANLTWYTSWPEPGSEECEDYNGCTWAGYFAGVNGQQTEQWVSEHNIIAIHEKDWNTYRLKTFRLKKGGATIDAQVLDMCSDSDCSGCCTRNAGSIGFLIDIESYTKARFNNQGSGVVEWCCLDCE